MKMTTSDDLREGGTMAIVCSHMREEKDWPAAYVTNWRKMGRKYTKKSKVSMVHLNANCCGVKVEGQKQVGDDQARDKDCPMRKTVCLSVFLCSASCLR